MSVVLADESVEAFAAEVGTQGPVAVQGGRTHWSVGGDIAPGTRLVTAPAGIGSYEPAEMTVRVGAGTTVADLNALLRVHGQMVPFDAVPATESTVGGVLAVGQSGTRRRKYGPIRDLLLQATYVNAAGATVVAGGPTVKNVSGYDLCRMLVGSIGTLGLLAEVILRCVPIPAASRWFVTSADPRDVSRSLYNPSSVLWDGQATWVLLEGNEADIAAESLQCGLVPTDVGPKIPAGGRESRPPADLFALDGNFLAEIGVGIVHRHEPVQDLTIGDVTLHQRLKSTLDPAGRLNPGRKPWS